MVGTKVNGNMVEITDDSGRRRPIILPVPEQDIDAIRESIGDRPVFWDELVRIFGAKAVALDAVYAASATGKTSGDLWLQSVRAFLLLDGRVATVQTWKSYMEVNSHKYESTPVYSSLTDFQQETAPYHLTPITWWPIDQFLLDQLTPAEAGVN